MTSQVGLPRLSMFHSPCRCNPWNFVEFCMQSVPVGGKDALWQSNVAMESHTFLVDCPS